MKKKFYIFILMITSVSCSFLHVDTARYNDNKTTFDIAFLNSHSESFDGKKVRVVGYVYSGFDGHHTSCFVTTKRGEMKLENISFIDDSMCYSGNKDEYKEGVAEVIGVFSKYENPVFISGVVYNSELGDASVKWKE